MGARPVGTRWARLSFGLFLGVVACASASEPQGLPATKRVSSAVEGGERTRSYAYSMAVLARDRNSICTGTLIAPNLVLTARHCVDVLDGPASVCTSKWQTQNNDRLEVAACDDVRGPEACADTVAVAEIVRTPGDTLCGQDLALLVLAKNVAATVARPVAPAVNVPMYDSRFNRTITAIGYGIDGPDGGGIGLRRIRENIRVPCIPGHPNPFLDCNGDGQEHVNPGEFPTAGGTCSGDSGSAALEQGTFNKGQPVILGVLSRAASSAVSCGLQGIYTRVDVWSDLLVATARRAAERGGYAVPSWAEVVVDAGAETGAPPPPVAEPEVEVDGTPPAPVEDGTDSGAPAARPEGQQAPACAITAASVPARRGGSDAGNASVLALALVGVLAGFRRRERPARARAGRREAEKSKTFANRSSGGGAFPKT